MPEHREERQDNKVAALSGHLKEKEQRIRQVLDCLAEESAKGIPIIVEGKKDVESLRTLHVEGEMVTAKTGGKSRLDVLSEIEEKGAKGVILLFDFDRRGKEWTKHLAEHLEKAKIRTDLTFWKALFTMIGKEVKDVEGIAAYMETLKSKINDS